MARGPGADPGAEAAPGALLRCLLECGARQAPQGRGAAWGPRLEWDLKGGPPDIAGAGGSQASMGESDPAGVRSGSARVSSLRRRDARREFHHRARPDQAHPGSPPQPREGRAPSPSTRPPAGGQHHLRANPSRPWTSAMGEGGVVGPGRPRGLSPRLAVLRARLTRPPEPSGGPDRAFRCRPYGRAGAAPEKETPMNRPRCLNSVSRLRGDSLLGHLAKLTSLDVEDEAAYRLVVREKGVRSHAPERLPHVLLRVGECL